MEIKKKAKPDPRKLEVGHKKQFEAWVNKKIGEILKELVIDVLNYQVNFIYNGEYRASNDNEMSMLFTIKPIKCYRQAMITVYPMAYKMHRQGKKDILIDGLVHELSHIHTEPLVSIAKERYATNKQINERNEELTELLAVYIRRLIKVTNNNVYK